MTKKPTNEELEVESSARRRAEEALRKSEALLKKSQSIARIGSWELDLIDNRLFWSDEVYRIFGVQSKEFEATYEAFLDTVHPDDRISVDAAYSESLREGRDTYEIEHRIVRRDSGEVRMVHEKCEHVKDASGRIVSSIGMAQDITERKKAEDALKHSEENYRNILDSIEEGYYEVDLAGNFTFFNDSVCRLLGYTRNEMMGMNNRQYTDPENAKELFRVFHNVYETGMPTKGFDWELIRKGGTRRFVEASVSLLRDSEDRPIGFRGIARDVTERKQSEKALKRERDFHRVLSTIAIEFITASPVFIDESIDRALEAIGNFVGADRSYVFRFDFQAGTISNTHEWCEEGVEPQIENLQNLPVEKFKWLINQLADLQVVHIPKVANLPKEANAEKEEFEAEGIQSLLLVPLVSEGRCVGTIGFDFVTQARRCSEFEIRLLHMSAATISNALDRKQAEEALKESEEKYKELFEEAPMGYLEYDSKGYITRVNRRGLEMLGYMAEEMVGKLAWNFVAEEEESQELITAKLAGDRPPSKSLERTCVRKDETTFPCLIEDVIFKDKTGRIIGNRSIFQDITERRRTEEEQNRLQAQLSNALEMAHLGPWEYDVANDLFTFNDYFYKTFRTTAEQVGGYTMTSAEYAGRFVHPDDRFLVGEEVLKAIETDDPRFGRQLEHRILYADGTPGYITVRFFVVKDSEGETVKTYGVNQDITERKKAEDRLRQSEEKLSRSKKMESLGLLAGGVAHDLNNVLAGIVSYPELLLLDLPEDSKYRKPIQTIQESGNKAVAIVQDLLTIARGVATPKEPLNLNVIVKEYLISPEFQKLKQFHPAITIKTVLEPDLLNMSGSPVHIRKVIMNLVSNASEAIEGRGNVIISTMNRYVDRAIRAYEDVKIGEYVVLRVSDDGSGILSDHLERIFEPFFTKKVQGKSGTGLGLAVVWNTVQDHEGYIDVSSDEKGTTFELYFPVIRDAVPAKGLPVSIEDYKGGGERILVVDDIESQRDITCNMLAVLGYNSIAVSSGEEAVEYLREHSVDVILLDMIMEPGINGRQTYERIIKIQPNQKAIIVSGFAETDDVKEAQKLGAGQYIRKPLTLERVGIAIKEELDKS